MAAAKRIILITGANSGIGFALASALITKSGIPSHIILGARNATKGAAALETLKAQHPTASLETVQLDITDDASIDAAIAQIAATHARLDILVNNAGALVSGTTLRARLVDSLNINAVGATILAHAAVPLLRAAATSASSPPRIVNISSGFGSITSRLDPATMRHDVSAAEYRISKAALNMASACMSVDYAGMAEHQGQVQGLKVFAYCPGFTKSQLTSETAREGSGARDTDEAVIPIVRIVDGERDHEADRFLWSQGVYGW